MWTRKPIKQTNHCLCLLVDNMPAYLTHRATVESRRKVNTGARWCCVLTPRQHLTELKKEAHNCQSSNRIYHFYAPVLKVVVKSVVTWSQWQTEDKLTLSVKLRSICLKETSSSQSHHLNVWNHTKTSSSTSPERNQVSNRKNRCLIKKEGFYQLLPDSLHPLLLIYLESFSNETRTNDDAGSRTFIAESWKRTPINIPATTRNTDSFRSRHETDHGFFITRRPKISLLDQLLHRYQGLSRQMKSKATVKPTVTTTVSPAPTETSPTSPPTTSLEKPKKVLSRKLPATPKSTAATGLKKSKIPRPVVRSASSGKQAPYSETVPVPETLESTPASQSKIPVAKVDEPVLPKVPAFLLETPLSTPARKRRITRKPRTPMVARLRSNRQWEPYWTRKKTCSPKERQYITEGYGLLCVVWRSWHPIWMKIRSARVVESLKKKG